MLVIENKRHRCVYCKILTYNWERVNGGPYRCWKCGAKIRMTENPSLFKKENAD